MSGIIAGWFVGGVAAAGNGARQFVRAWRFRGRLSGKYAPRRRVRRYGVRLEGLTTSHTTSPSGTRLSKHAHRSTPSAACRSRGRTSSSFVASSRSTASSSTSPPSERRGDYLGTTLCDAKVSLEACYTKRSVPYLQKDCHQKSPWFSAAGFHVDIHVSVLPIHEQQMSSRCVTAAGDESAPLDGHHASDHLPATTPFR